MLGIYFSGTGNSRFCAERFCFYYDGSKPLSIEDSGTAEAIRKSEEITLAYPTHYSNIPKIVRDFIRTNKSCFVNKRIYVIATMGLFSGDGAGCGARLLKKCGGKIIGGLHLKMPDCIGDVKALKKPLAENQHLVINAEEKIKRAVNALKQDDPTQEGLGFLCHVAGLFGQRLWFYGKTMRYTDKLNISENMCTSCGACVGLCPMKNLTLTHQKPSAGSKCTMCYRCINSCPNKAITLLGKAVVEQCKLDKYIT
ncbi:MAG: EFR1 family ferrodoxin [Peptococcaceae bacterium]|nr:EFR1 family ferrodoxin [Peptococcaceae bacterium]